MVGKEQVFIPVNETRLKCNFVLNKLKRSKAFNRDLLLSEMNGAIFCKSFVKIYFDIFLFNIKEFGSILRPIHHLLMEIAFRLFLEGNEKY